MTGRVRRAAAALSLLLGACGGDPSSTVADYFRALRVDPVRTMLLTTDDFHRRHGLRRTLASDVDPAAASRATESPPAAGEVRPETALARARLGWLLLVRLQRFRHTAGELAFETLRATGDERRAVVETRVSAPGMPAFTQRFVLVRSPVDGRWQIDEIRQEGVLPASRLAAFIAAPVREGYVSPLPPNE